jgi:hypothetical protein
VAGVQRLARSRWQAASLHLIPPVISECRSGMRRP